MNFDAIVKDVSEMGLNLYDMAIYTEKDGILSHQFQRCSRCHNSYSVAKVFIVTALGLLSDDGKLQVTDSLWKWLGDEFPKNADPALKIATLENAITHRLGFSEGFLDIDVEDVTTYPTEDWLQIVLSHPLGYLPGMHEQYSDAAYYLLSRVVSRVADEPADALLQRRIFGPMRFSETAWSRCPLGYPIGATGLYLSARDTVKLGALYMNDGVWEGKRLLSESWVRRALACEYGFHPMTTGGELIGKGGMYGQAVAFCPEKRFALAWHTFENAQNGGRLLSYLEKICHA